MALNGLKCILIDVDNTLLDFEKSSQMAIIRTCEDFKIPYSSELLAVFLTVNNEMWRQIQDGALTKEQLWQTRWNKIFNISGITLNLVNVPYQHGAIGSGTLQFIALLSEIDAAKYRTKVIVANGI